MEGCSLLGVFARMAAFCGQSLLVYNFFYFLHLFIVELSHYILGAFYTPNWTNFHLDFVPVFFSFKILEMEGTNLTYLTRTESREHT